MEELTLYPDTELYPISQWDQGSAFYSSCSNECDSNNKNVPTQCYTGYDSSTEGFYCLTGDFSDSFDDYDESYRVYQGAVPTLCSKYDRFCVVS